MNRRAALDRYGPYLGLLTLLALLVVVLPATDETEQVGASGTVAGSDTAVTDPGSTGPGGAGDPSIPGTGGTDPLTGLPSVGGPATSGNVGPTAPVPPPPPGANCRADGRQPGISVYMPPCLPLFTGDNGGATSRGVEGDRIIVARYVVEADPATQGASSAIGLSDSEEVRDRGNAALVRYMNLHFETFAREVVIVDVIATGTSDQAQRADAARIAEEVGAFAVYPATASTETPAFVEEAAARDLICICSFVYPQSFYDRVRDRVFNNAPPLDDHFAHAAEYIAKRLAGLPARWSGSFQQRTRQFGLVYLENPFPNGGPPQPGNRAARDFFVSELARQGVSLARDVGYTYDLTRAQEQATNVIAQMSEAGVTTLAYAGDPLTLIFLTREATRQAYFPEWFITGTLATDITFFGRTFDPLQWIHAFGISPLPVQATSYAGTPGYQAYHSARPGEPAGNEGQTVLVLYPVLQILFTGIQMAGPQLTPDTFAQGLYAYPATGGNATNPLVFFTPNRPMAFKDFTEIYWDGRSRGNDELGNDGVGVIRFLNGGARYRLGQWPTGEPAMFDPSGTVTVSDDPPRVVPEQDEQPHPPEQRCRSCT